MALWLQVAALVGLGTLIIMGTIQLVLVSVNTGTPVVCSDGNACTRDVSKDGICEYKYWDTRQACATCYTQDAHCDGHGTCVGAPANCLGTCASDNAATCDNLWQFNTLLTFGACMPTGTVCTANTCVGFVFFPLFFEAFKSIGPTTGLQCTDVLNATFYAANKTCIKTERFLDDTATWDSEESEEWHVCLYYWTCSVLDQAWLQAFYSESAAGRAGLVLTNRTTLHASC